jgi:hypothetical protein
MTPAGEFRYWIKINWTKLNADKLSGEHSICRHSEAERRGYLVILRKIPSIRRSNMNSIRFKLLSIDSPSN